MLIRHAEANSKEPGQHAVGTSLGSERFLRSLSPAHRRRSAGSHILTFLAYQLKGRGLYYEQALAQETQSLDTTTIAVQQLLLFFAQRS